MGASEENSPTTLPPFVHLPVSAPNAAVNDLEKQKERDVKVAHLLAGAYLPGDTLKTVLNLMDKDPEEKQRAGKIIEILLRLRRVLWEAFLDVMGDDLEEQKQVAELLLGLSPGTQLSFLDLMCEESKEQSSPTMALAWRLKSDRTEAIIGKNKRDVVSSEEMEAGHVRAVVKIVSKFHGGVTFSGTGVLISDRVLLTAGHNLFDKNNDESPAESVTILAGVNGTSGSIESREGIYAVLPHGWYANRAKQQDIGLIFLEQPFETVTPMKIRQTPSSDKGTVHGYSSDKPYYGLKLCKSVSVMKYDHCETAGMVEHEADTVKGNSGGPVLDEDGFIIAIHRGWDKKDGAVINHAVAIDREGNDIAAFVAVLDHMVKRDRGNGHGFGDVGVMAKEDSGVKVEMIREVKKAKGFKGFAFRW